MQKVEVRGVAIDTCASCQAVWFDHEVIETYFQSAVRLPYSLRVSPYACPRCTRSLHEVKESHSGMQVATCRYHGMFAGAEAARAFQYNPAPTKLPSAATAAVAVPLVAGGLAMHAERRDRSSVLGGAVDVGEVAVDVAGDVDVLGAGAEAVINGVCGLLGGLFDGF